MFNSRISIETIIKISLWAIFVGLSVTSFFDFEDWTSRLSWSFRFLLLALILHIVVSWIYRD